MSSAVVLLRSRVVGAFAAASLLAGLLLAPAVPAQAQPGCVVVETQSTSWTTAAGEGGYLLNLRLTNICDQPVPVWELVLGLAPDHTATQGWNAQWSLTSDPLVATTPPWLPALSPGGSITIGLLGHWRGAYADPVLCLVNGSPCGGGPEPNQPPTVAMTSPAPSTPVIVPGTVTLAADAADPDGAVDRVEFYLDGELVGTDDTYPHEVAVPIDFNFCTCVAFARAFDTGEPPLSTDSEPVSFIVVTVPPVPIIATPTELTVTEGGTAEFNVRLGVDTGVIMEVFVVGDPGVTAAPATFVLNSENWDTGQVVTVSAAPGSAPATATVFAATAFSGSATVAVTVVGGAMP